MDSNKKKTTTLKITKFHIYLTAFMIPFLIVLISMLSSGFAPFGSKDILTAGGYQSLYSFFHEFHDRLHEGALFTYSMNNGLGYDFTTVITYYMSDPLNWIVLIFPNSSLPALFNLLFAFKAGLAGLLFTAYLRNKNSLIRLKKHKAYEITEKLNCSSAIIIALSTAYALSSYMLCYGINITYSTAVAVFPLVMLGLDKLVYEGNKRTYIIAITLSCFANFYITLIVFLFSVFYTVLQEYDSFRDPAATMISKFAADILAFGLSAIILINNFTSIFYKNNIDIHFYTKGFFSSVWNALKMMFVNAGPYQATQSSYGISIYSGLICIFMLIPYILCKNIKLSHRVKNLTMLIFLFLACMGVTTNYLFNFFHMTKGYSAFFGFIFCFLIINICHSAIIYISELRPIKLIISFAVTLGIIILTMLFCEYYDSASTFITSMEFVMGFFLILLLYTQSKTNVRILRIILSLAIIAELSFNSFTNMKSLSDNSVPYTETIEYSAEAAKAYIRQEAPSARIFTYDPSESTVTPFTYMVNGYDFILADSTVEMDSFLEPIGDVGSISVYRNPYSLSSGFGIDSHPSVEQYMRMNPYSSSNIFIEEILHSDPIFISVIGSAIANNTDPTAFSGMVYEISESGDFYCNLASLTFHVNNVKANTPFSVVVPRSMLLSRDRNIGGELMILDKAALDKLYKTITSNNVENSSYYILPITEAEKWSTPSGNVNSINISGNDIVYTDSPDISFTPKYFYIGMIVSIISLLVCVGLYVLSLKNKLSDNRITTSLSTIAERFEAPITLFVTSSAMFILIFMYTCSAPFGYYSSFISDGYAQYYPIVTNGFSKIFSGSFSALNYQMGFGIDNFNLLSGFFLSPLAWPIGLFKNIYSLTAYTFCFYLSFIMIPLSMYLYLSHRPKASEKRLSKTTIIICSLVYTFSSYVITYFTFFLAFAYIIPLVLLATEHLLYNKKVVPYIIVMVYTMITQNYSAFLICEFLVLFFFITDFESVKDFFVKGIRFALASIISAGLSAFVLIPFYYFTKLSPYKGNDSRISIGLDNHLLDTIYDMQWLHIPDPVTEDSYRTNIYCGILIFLFFGLYMINSKIKLSVRIRTLLLQFFLFFAFGNEFLNFILHGFHRQVMVPNRFSIFFIFMLIICFADTFAVITELPKKRVLISLSVWSAVLSALFIYKNINSFDQSFYGTIGLIVLNFVLITILVLKKKNILKKALLYILVTEVLFYSYMVSHISIGAPVATSEIVISETRTLADRYNMGSDKLTRTELINYWMINGSCFTNTNSITYFSSITTHYNTDLTNAFNILTGTNTIDYLQGNPLSNLMLSVKYFFSSDYNGYFEIPSYYKKIDQLGSTKLYENEFYLSPGILIPSDSRTNRLDFKNVLDQQNTFSKNLGGDDIYQIITPEIISREDFDESAASDDKVYLVYEYIPSEDLYDTEIIVPDSIKGYIYLSYLNTIYYLGDNTNGDDEFGMSFDEEFLSEDYVKTIKIGVPIMDNLWKLHDKLSENTMTDLKYGFNTIEGHIDAAYDGMIFLTVPAYDTWDVYVDGNHVQHEQFMGATGIPVPAGNHDIKLIYHTSGLREGAIISLVSLIIFILFLIIRRMMMMKKTDNPNNESDDSDIESYDTDNRSDDINDSEGIDTDETNATEESIDAISKE